MLDSEREPTIYDLTSHWPRTSRSLTATCGAKAIDTLLFKYVFILKRHKKPLTREIISEIESECTVNGRLDEETIIQNISNRIFGSLS